MRYIGFTKNHWPQYKRKRHNVNQGWARNKIVDQLRRKKIVLKKKKKLI